jgi:hypothetical protein
MHFLATVNHLARDPPKINVTIMMIGNRTGYIEHPLATLYVPLDMGTQATLPCERKQLSFATRHCH